MDFPWRVRTLLVQGPPGPAGKFSSNSLIWTPPSTANGGFSSTTLIVTGVVVGQNAHAAFSVDVTPGAFFVAQVSAANTVRVLFYNFTGAPYTPGAGTVWVDVSLHP